MNLLADYEAAIAEGLIEHDPIQRLILAKLQQIANEVLRSSRWFKRSKPIKGLYLYGPVGAGKTFVMDLFYNALPLKQKTRFHFHHFMQQVDAQLRSLQGLKDPLKKIASDLAKKSRVLCLDEFLVYDIADAMILAQLLKALFSHQVILVATSNTPPDQLYLKGLQRARFLPAIDLIKQHCDVMALGDKRDYRLGRVSSIDAYLCPLNEVTEKKMNDQFHEIAPKAEEHSTITVQTREIRCKKISDEAVWFEFNVICNLPRSQLDYLEIADRFNTIFVSGIPTLSSQDMVKVILLMHFIDVMYDNGIRVIISAEAPPDELYQQGPLHAEFQRTVSRLFEMQSFDYLNRELT
ncbi:cell division protein ZapE [Legionella impletisoli]|uniref:Cell division protein ZapE n=1 Tax=Legionella impletisoli TaxID=343510 RepID=A0A917NCH2_9GAMM|nr:cell division protein ZapE [Legionella impletisoli]GGI89003.1 cell division protein ZapE [Legionella impletisoli]